MPHHPHPDHHGHPVVIRHPHTATPSASWIQPDACAVALPGATLDERLASPPFATWSPPTTDAGWEQLAQASPVEEPPFACPAGLKAAAGAVVREPDGRIWCVAPTNRFGGHEFTFPKGRTDGRTTAATALVEVFEESGLAIRLRSFLCDVPRSQTFTRFYLAERVGGSPADAGWESQAVGLATTARLVHMLTHPGDQVVLARLLQATHGQ